MASAETYAAPAASVPSPERKPEMPKPSEAVARLLCAGITSSRFIYPEGAPAYQKTEEWTPPPVLNEDLMREVEQLLAELERVLEPAEAGPLLTRVLTLLSHYRSEPNPPAVETMMAEDWAEDLGGFPLWAVAQASRWWRRNRRFRPQICEMRKLCEEAVGDAHTLRDRLRAIVTRGHRDRNPLAERMAAIAASSFGRIG
jgi:hypothetical protein